jgi:hypothetical protein
VLLTARQHRNAEREFLPAKVLSPNNTNKADPTTRADGCEDLFKLKAKEYAVPAGEDGTALHHHAQSGWIGANYRLLPRTHSNAPTANSRFVEFVMQLHMMTTNCPQDFGLDATLEAAEREDGKML